MADLSIISEHRNPTDLWLKGILTSKASDDYHPDEVKSHLDDFGLDEDLGDKEELPNAMEFVSVECNMLFESDLSIGSEQRFEEKPVRKKKHKSKKNKLHSKSSKKNVFPLLYPLPIISELFRYRSVDVYKRSDKDGPFVKIFTSDPVADKSGLDDCEQREEDYDSDVSVKRFKDQECDICGRQLLAQDIESHLQRDHMDGNLFKCEVCRKKFIDKAHLIAHRILHVNVVGKPYPCPLCKERFTNKTALKNHSQCHISGNNIQPDLGLSIQPEPGIRSPQAISTSSNYRGPLTDNGKKEFQCQHCHKSFMYKVQCTSHEKLHSSNISAKCDSCDGTFSLKQMASHQKKHSKGKPYQCDKCGSAFRARSSLWSHKKSHVGQKPRECPDCGSMFWKSSALKKHRKAYHD